MAQSKVNREVIYANSMHGLNQRIKFKTSVGWQLVGEIKQGLDGRYGCLIEREIRFN